MNIQGHPFSGDEHTYVIERYTRIGDELKMEALVHGPDLLPGAPRDRIRLGTRA